MSKNTELAEVGPWAEQKLAALADYLGFYTTVLKNQRWCKTIYLDAFAGGGSANLRKKAKVTSDEMPLWDEPPQPEQSHLILGSPRRALEVTNPFHTYVFVDADAKRIAQLESLKAEYGQSRRIVVRQGSAAQEIS